MTSLKEPQEVTCLHCKGTGRIMVPAEIDTVKAFYFGCWDDAGHYWHSASNYYMTRRQIEAEVPPIMRNGQIDSGFCPGVYKERSSLKNSRPEVEGEAQLTHTQGWTVLAWWDRSIDSRPGSNSAIVVQGSFDFTTMVEVGRRRLPSIMSRQRQEIVLVETTEQ